jgi:hypothetical protein
MGLSPQRFGVAPRHTMPRLERPSHIEIYHDPLGAGSESPLAEMSDSASVDPQRQAIVESPRPLYERRAIHDPNDTMKFHMGQEIAQVMGPSGIPRWKWHVPRIVVRLTVVSLEFLF